MFKRTLTAADPAAKRPGHLASSEQKRHSLILLAIFLTGIGLFAILTFFNHRIAGSDDTVFQTQILPYHNVLDWIVYRYQSWSGRIFSEGFVYVFSSAPLIFWQIVSVVMYALFAGMLFAYYKLFAKEPSAPKDYLMLTAALCLLFLANKRVLAEGGLWVTGAMVYFWISAVGLVAFYPVAFYVAKRQKPHWLVTAIGLLCAVVAASSQEQAGAVLLGLSTVFLAHEAATRRKIPWYLVLFWVAMFSALLISVAAPGNPARLRSETATWLPDFYAISPLKHLEVSYRWLLEAFINHAGYLLVASWTFMTALFMGKKAKTHVDYLFIFTLALASLFAATKGSETTSALTNFYATWKPSLPNALVSLNLLPWGVALVCTVAAPLILWRRQRIGYLLATLYLAAAASAAVVTLSPTLYASLWRCFFVPSVLLMVIVYILLEKISVRYWTNRFVVIGFIVIVALSHYLYQAARLIHRV